MSPRELRPGTRRSSSRRPSSAQEITPPLDDEWRAISERERRFDGRFVWVALTTSIYCRPSCAARRPRRQTVLVLPTAADAERRGYLSCARCHPDTAAAPASERGIAMALAHIHAHANRSIRLRTLSDMAGLSSSYFQRLFTRLVGLSPRSYCEHRRLSRFKDLLRSGRGVSDAAYEAGYGSIRALYERASIGLGMSPATYSRGADGARVRYSVLDSTQGPVLVALTERGICAALLGSCDAALVGELSRQVPRATLSREGSPTAALRRTVRLCEPEAPLLSMLPLSVRREVFQARIAETLMSTFSPGGDRRAVEEGQGDRSPRAVL
jgi:AraC family transcriptional regulator of adaptative response/methylated-DNA-[protein]-cysteine methyltransferase